ncbi:MAG: hypothetical protein JO041_08865 [Acidobacteria bacterium]|nr:hypothetical protein [Acidobacteriota bacterium]
MPATVRLLAAVALMAGSVFAQVPASKHVFVLAEENTSYQHLVGSPDMPYLNSLLAKGTVFTQFYANQHDSITDYFLITSGQIPTSNDATTLTYDVDNLVRRALQAGMTYRVYAQSLPYAGFAGVQSGPYLKRHTALPYYSDMGNSPVQMLNLVPVPQLLTDIQSGSLPNFGFITPDANNDLHDCPATTAACRAAADQFLQTYIAPLLARPEFQPGGDGLLIIWTDEADLGTDNSCAATISSGCGGHIVVSAIGPRVKAGYQSPVTYHHEHVLSTVLNALRAQAPFPGLAQNAPPMSDMFLGNPNGVPSPPPAPLAAVLQSPANNSITGTRVHVAGSGSGPGGVATMQIYVDGQLAASVSGSSIDTYVTVTPGAHAITLKAWDPTGGSALQTAHITAKPLAVAIQAPAANATLSTSVAVVASSSGPVVTMQIYVDGILAYTVNAASLSTVVSVSPGPHALAVKAWDNTGNSALQSINIAASGVSIQSPLANAVVASPVTITATAYDPLPIVATQVYIDGVLQWSRAAAGVNTPFALTSGVHHLAVKIWDSAGKSYVAGETISVK